MVTVIVSRQLIVSPIAFVRLSVGGNIGHVDRVLFRDLYA